MSYKIKEVLINEQIEPLGLDLKPVFSWKYESDENCMVQKKYIIRVIKDNDEVWNSGIIEDSKSIAVSYEGRELEAESRYKVVLTTWNQIDEEAVFETSFETGLLNDSMSAWEEAEWIGAPEYYVASDTISVFSIESKISIAKGGSSAGIIFGANDERLLNKYRNEMQIAGNNYFCFALNVAKSPAVVEIYRVGYDKNDSAEKPFAELPAISVDSMKSVITKENKYYEHTLRIDVTGNCAYTYVDNILIDKVKRIGFMGEEEAPRQLNSLGYNDVTTFPRLCDIGYYVKKGTKASFDGLIVKNLRDPKAVIAERDKEDGKSIKADKKDVFETFNPSKHSLPMLRSDFIVANKDIESARLYVTARGIYHGMINGREISNDYFAPGASQYDKHLMYQTYDVTEHITEVNNGIGFVLSSGWWSDASTYSLENYNFWGDKPSLLAKLVINYKDGTREVVVSDHEKWNYFGEGPFIYSGFFNGEQFDSRRKDILDDFSKAGFEIEGLKKPVVINPYFIKSHNASPFLLGWPDVNKDMPKIVGSYNAPVREIETFTAIGMTSPAPGVYIYDLGQEIAGIPQITFSGEKGTRAVIRYGEMIYPDLPEYEGLVGHMLQANLREASNTDVYILNGENDVFKPKFTFHGFRYIEITGISKPLPLNCVQGILLSSIDDVTGSFYCDNKLINKFVSNVKYSNLSNYISVPTDCPQRNERMGWCGDTQVFAKTATYLSNVKNFLLRNMEAIKDLQNEDGRMPNIAPFGGGFGGITYESTLIILTWELYQQYGDIKIIKDNYPAMKKWMKLMHNVGMPGDTFVGPLADWLSFDETDSHLVWNAFYGRDARYMAEFADILGYADESSYYKEIEENTSEYWNEHFVNQQDGITMFLDGSVCDTQSSYSIGLDCGMFKGCYKEIAEKHLLRKVKEAEYTIRTGFFGTGPLTTCLTKGGFKEDAYKLITQTVFPSWLYPVTQGATTIWERWDSFTVEKGFGGNNSMNSFNHYSLGSVLSWFYETVLGIQRDENNPGYAHFKLQPEIYGFEYAGGGFESPYGKIESSWQKENDKIKYRCVIPENTTATLKLNDTVMELGSGIYTFEETINNN